MKSEETVRGRLGSVITGVGVQGEELVGLFLILCLTSCWKSCLTSLRSARTSLS